MPKENDQDAAFEQQFKAVMEQVDTARERWMKVVGMRKTVEAIAKALPTIPKGMGSTKDGKMIIAAGLAEFGEVDALIANIDRCVGEYSAAIQQAQSTFDQMFKSDAAQSADLGHHVPAIEAIMHSMPSLIQSAAQAQAAWSNGKAVFMPIYLKAKLGLAATAAEHDSFT